MMNTVESILLALIAISVGGSAIAGGFKSEHRYARDVHHADYQRAHGSHHGDRHYRSDRYKDKAYGKRGHGYKLNRHYRRNHYNHDYFGFSYFRYYDRPSYPRRDQYGYRHNHRHHSNCRH